MLLRDTSRRICAAAAVASLCLPLAMGRLAAAQPPQAAQPSRPAAARSLPPRPPNQEHLAEWMDRHRNLSPAEQQHALESEEGFRELPPQLQQRYRDRLAQLNNMTPQKRQRVLERTEEMEHLSVPQRQQVRGAMLQLSSLPPDRRRLVARAFRDLRALPPDQRQAAFASNRFRAPFTEAERATLAGLLTVEPLLPPPHRDAPPQAP